MREKKKENEREREGKKMSKGEKEREKERERLCPSGLVLRDKSPLEFLIVNDVSATYSRIIQFSIMMQIKVNCQVKSARKYNEGNLLIKISNMSIPELVSGYP